MGMYGSVFIADILRELGNYIETPLRITRVINGSV